GGWDGGGVGRLLRGDVFVEVVAFADDLPRDFTTDRRNFALQVPDASLARVPLDDRLDRIVVDDDVLGAETGAFNRLRGEEALCDFDLLGLSVAGKLQDFHAVAQRLRDRFDLVRPADDHA